MDARSPAPSLRMSGVQIDSSRLPPVQEVCRDFAVLEDGAFAYCLQEQEIEQHYASNVQRNQLVQKDLRIAKTLQGMEDRVSRLRISRQQQQQQQQQSKERDSKTAHAAQEESHPRTKTDQEVARRLQRLEEGENCMQEEGKLKSLEERQDPKADPLSWLVEEESLQSKEQLRQDEELAWRLQEEEHARATRARRNRERNDDYRVAQVAQDEEIARYMQDQELKARWRSSSEEAAGKSEARPEVAGGHQAEPRWSRHNGQEAERPWLNSTRNAAAPVGRVHPLERGATPVKGSPAGATKLPQPCQNIAEELDPTFKAKGVSERPVVLATAVRSRAATPIPSVPVDGLFDYFEFAGPAFVSPTKRQPEKPGHPKPRDKKEGCKQQ